MPRAERGDADADEEPGVIAVQTTLLHHVIRDVARGPTAVEFIADLVSGDYRGLRVREGDASRAQRIYEIAVDRVGMRGWDYYAHSAGQRDHQDEAGQQ